MIADAQADSGDAPDLTANSVLVVAHPDDEVLWFSGVLVKVDHVIVCFGSDPFVESIGNARRRVAARYPLTNVSWLEIDEPHSLLAADWRTPTADRCGIELKLASGVRGRYRRAFAAVSEALDRALRPFGTVITHNPWGEYGHEDHVLVHRAAAGVAARLGSKLWCTSYSSRRSAAFAAQYTQALERARRITLVPDAALAHGIKKIYEEERCWTWPASYEWPRAETYLELSAAAHQMAPEPLPLHVVTALPFETHAPLGDHLRGLVKNCLPRSLFAKVAPAVRRLRAARSPAQPR